MGKFKEPHGGQLKDLYLPAAEVEAAKEAAEKSGEGSDEMEHRAQVARLPTLPPDERRRAKQPSQEVGVPTSVLWVLAVALFATAGALLYFYG